MKKLLFCFPAKKSIFVYRPHYNESPISIHTPCVLDVNIILHSDKTKQLVLNLLLGFHNLYSIQLVNTAFFQMIGLRCSDYM